MAKRDNYTSNHRHTNSLPERAERRDNTPAAHESPIPGLQGPKGVEGITKWVAQ